MGGKARGLRLPAGSMLTAPELHQLSDLITRFKPQARTLGWGTPGGAAKQCALASTRFMQAAEYVGLDCELAFWEATHEGAFERYPYNVGDCVGHNAVRVGDIIVDWTARQFDSRAPFPAMWLDSESVFDERITIPVAMLEFQTTGDTIWIHDSQGRTVMRIKSTRRLGALRVSRKRSHGAYADVVTHLPISIDLAKGTR